MRELRGLCIGAGYFSRFHMDGWRRIAGVRIVGVCDRDAAKAAAAAREFGVEQSFTDAAEAMDAVQPDFVDIITPPISHFELVQAALSRSIATICQKPLAPTFAEARALIQMTRGHEARFMVHENFRFQPWHREIHRLLDTGVVGRRLHRLTMRTRMGDGWGAEAYLARQPYFRTMPRMLMHETGVHFADVFTYLGGEIDRVQAVIQRLNQAIAGEDAALVSFGFRSGSIGIWDANRYNEGTAANPRYTFGQMTVETDGGTIHLSEDGRITIHPLGQAPREHPYEHADRGFAGDCVYLTQRHFIDRLRDGMPFETNGESYLQTLAVVEAAYRSAESGCAVSVSDVMMELPHRRRRRVVDLSLPIDEHMPGVTIHPAKRLEVDGWNASTLSLYSHAGTHMDAPAHFIHGGASIDQQGLGVCCGPAKVVNLAPVEPRELLTVARLGDAANGIVAGDRILLRTDWHPRYGTPEYRSALPRISAELARWLAERGVALLGVEPPSVADVNNLAEVTQVHEILLGGGVVIVEGLAHLDQLDAVQVEFIALPLKVIGGDGTPVRAIAIIEH